MEQERKGKSSLDYFFYDVGLMKDRKFRKARVKYGYLALIIYLALLELIYGDKGYYLLYDESTRDDVIWDLQEYCRGKYTVEDTTISDVIETLTACELFSRDCLERGIITSKRIQETYYRATVERRNMVVDPDIWLLTIDEMKAISTKSSILSFFQRHDFGSSSGDVRVNFNENQPNIEENQPNLQQSREDKSREDKIRVDKSREKNAPTIPTIDDVKQFAGECKSNVDPERFYNYYQAQNWKIGNSYITDWKAKFKSWEKTEKGVQAVQQAKPTQTTKFVNYNQPEYTDEEIEAAIRRKKQRRNAEK